MSVTVTVRVRVRLTTAGSSSSVAAATSRLGYAPTLALALTLPLPLTLASGGGDKKVKLWHYDEGSQYFEGAGHSGTIIMAKVAPDRQRVVTVGTEGGIFLWKVPDVFANAA